MRDFNKPDDGMEVRTLVNRTFHNKERVQAVKDFVTSPNYTWERGDTLEIIEAKM